MQESFIERQIREAMESGAFDDLPGAGKPIEDLDRPYDPDWWARKWAQREGLKEKGLALALRIERRLPRILAGRDEAEVALALQALNDEIATVNAELDPADRLEPLDVDRMLAARRKRRG